MAESEPERVTLATFSWMQDALVLKSALENEGIRAYIPEEHQASINPFMTGMVVRVQVDSEDLEDARKVLAVGAEQEPAQTEEPSRIPNWLRVLIGLVFLVPMRGHRPARRDRKD